MRTGVSNALILVVLNLVVMMLMIIDRINALPLVNWSTNNSLLSLLYTLSRVNFYIHYYWLNKASAQIVALALHSVESLLLGLFGKTCGSP